MKNVVELLKESTNVCDYKVIKRNKESFELFFVHDKLETVRATNTKETMVTVYVDHKKFRGDSTFTISPADDENILKNKIENACEMASLINNKHYDLIEDETAVVEIPTNFKNYEFRELGTKIYNVLKECVSKSKAKLNATEIFINKYARTVTNSRGIDKTEYRYDAMIETIPTYDKRAKNDSVELYESISFSQFDEETLKKRINQSLKDVTARAKAKKPDYDINVPVLLRTNEIAEIISNIKYNLTYGSVYSKKNLYKKGDLIQTKPMFDTLDITACGQIEGSPLSRAFDNDGVSLGEQKIVRQGKACNYYGSMQYAKYLNKKVTGDLPLTVLKKGKFSERALKSEPYLECVSFSGLQVDIANDYIGGEVRLANYFDGTKVTPVTGIAISGKFSEVINTIKLSNKQIVEQGYKGPAYALLSKFKIS